VAGLVAQVAAVLATGNRPVLPDDPAGRQVSDALPPGVCRLAPAPADADVEAVLADLPAARLATLRADIAERPGAIVSVILPEAPLRYPLWRLAVERSLSVNTAAAGGNAALLAQDESISSP
jgi:RHH-type proline utilization regulon transcriptional repressor/proline dehydrogenase/delta 1-pyrroline-5-carboxylate dehydrogenase